MNFLKLFSKKQKNKVKMEGYDFAASSLLNKSITIEELTTIINIHKDFYDSNEFDSGIQKAIDDYIELKNNSTNNDKLEGLIISWEKELAILKKESIYPEFHNFDALINDLKQIMDTKEFKK